MASKIIEKLLVPNLYLQPIHSLSSRPIFQLSTIGRLHFPSMNGTIVLLMHKSETKVSVTLVSFPYVHTGLVTERCGFSLLALSVSSASTVHSV